MVLHDITKNVSMVTNQMSSDRFGVVFARRALSPPFFQNVGFQHIRYFMKGISFFSMICNMKIVKPIFH